KLFPDQMSTIARGQMHMDQAIELSQDMSEFVARVEDSLNSPQPLNGIVGDIENYDYVDAREMLNRMWNVASNDVEQLLAEIQGE
ncbi:MAG: hypothetical protein VB814_10540, partial [Pirellulaceae bacterium]